MTAQAIDFRGAVALHQSGDLARAASIYREVLEADPGHADALHLLGLIASDSGHHEAGAALISSAIGLRGGVPLYCANLGMVMRRQGKLEEATACYRQALASKPDDAAVLVKLGGCLRAMGKPAEAIPVLRASIALDPGAPAYYELGEAARAVRHNEEAIECFRRAAALDPGLAEAHFSLGNLFFAGGDWDRGAEAYECAIRADGTQGRYFFNLGVIRTLQKRLPEAIECYWQTVQRQPESAEAHNNLANLFQKAGEFGRAAHHYERALQIRPDYPEVRYNLASLLQECDSQEQACELYRNLLENEMGLPLDLAERTRNNLGNGLLALGRPEEALSEYERVLRANPEAVEARWNRSVTNLTLGNFEAGWRDFDCRLRQPHVLERHLGRPRWTGNPLQNRIVLVHAEQGLGDTLQFVRYVPWVAERGAGVILECQHPLLRLLRRIPGVKSCRVAGSELPEFDLQIPLMSLPVIFGTTLDTIPGSKPYLTPDSALLEQWKEHVDRHTGDLPLRVGICWAGNPRHLNDRNRSVPPELFSQLAGVPGVAYFSLQVGSASEPGISFVPLLAPLGDFEDTAALVANLDLVISVDTAVAHLAGALGSRLWLLLPYAADWRWLTQRNDSPWYPTARLFRQSKPRDWESVLKRVRAELADFKRGARRSSPG